MFPVSCLDRIADTVEVGNVNTHVGRVRRAVEIEANGAGGGIATNVDKQAVCSVTRAERAAVRAVRVSKGRFLPTRIELIQSSLIGARDVQHRFDLRTNAVGHVHVRTDTCSVVSGRHVARVGAVCEGQVLRAVGSHQLFTSTTQNTGCILTADTCVVRDVGKS